MKSRIATLHSLIGAYLINLNGKSKRTTTNNGPFDFKYGPVGHVCVLNIITCKYRGRVNDEYVFAHLVLL